MHRQIDAAVDQRILNFFRKQAFASDATQGHVGDAISGRLDDLDAAFRAAGFQPPLYIMSLPKRELRPARSNHQHVVN
jgi:hypothetical protein